jgi:hypothetical protein
MHTRNRRIGMHRIAVTRQGTDDQAVPGNVVFDLLLLGGFSEDGLGIQKLAFGVSSARQLEGLQTKFFAVGQRPVPPQRGNTAAHDAEFHGGSPDPSAPESSIRERLPFAYLGK